MPRELFVVRFGRTNVCRFLRGGAGSGSHCVTISRKTPTKSIDLSAAVNGRRLRQQEAINGRERPTQIRGPFAGADVSPRPEARRGLEAEALLLRSQLASVSGSIFDFLNYFASVIEEYKLKPWGPRGRKYLLSAIIVLANQGSFEHWISCEKCHREFKPMHDERVLDTLLAYYREQLDWSALARCERCGGLACESALGDS